MKIYRHNGLCNLAGKNIRRFREQMGMSQEQLAAALQLVGLDMGQKAISRIETGDRVLPDYELLYFAEVLQVSVIDLLE